MIKLFTEYIILSLVIPFLHVFFVFIQIVDLDSDLDGDLHWALRNMFGFQQKVNILTIF